MMITKTGGISACRFRRGILILQEGPVARKELFTNTWGPKQV